MRDFLTFRKMITPLVIQILFWVGIVTSVFSGIFLIVTADGGVFVLQGIFLLLLGPLIVRIYCEVLIIFFRINENLVEIKNNTNRGVE
ncbi:DUF4282 domain-containing protein [Patescibacteria group bacterium]|nr:DUF4282 domain-containing protein [Patescibacteria group bacterium]MBU1246861.1 DUF4282 domain-containing protein [Patescibacteria group bacterium]MBU1519503.1 DUF4282 domain-containing protein [Patescibacteria group bacterium]MBU1956149.1 DUF4282 domain-containing protein [Patescibacteria group bacterium]MBU2416967.1 DUF4282 domain-containing protein [Patescibacteria group bacterium]